jgi:hypothetical protein
MTHYTSHSPQSFERWFRKATVAILLCLVSAQGCNWTIPRGEGFNKDEMSTWSQNLRKEEKSEGTPLGTSNKALEIERNLGYK